MLAIIISRVPDIQNFEPAPRLDADTRDSEEKIWYVGEHIPDLRANAEKVIKVQADGDELEYIKKRFIGLPYPAGRTVVIWFGCQAQHIVANL